MSAETNPRIEPLARYPALATWLAVQHHAEWAQLMPGWTLEDATCELAAHAARERPPTTLVAFDGDAAAGSVSVVEVDAPEFSDRSPWLASLWVRPESRGRGIGGALVDAAVHLAGAHGWSRLHLFTPAHGDWYAARGWQRLERRLLAGVPVEILTIDTSLRRGLAA